MKITGEEFTNLIEKDPSWCLTIKKPLEITTYVNLEYSKITHLSELLNFTGKNTYGDSADFSNCKNLKTATGNFKHGVMLQGSGIEKVEKLNVGIDDNGNSAGFTECKNLKTASGNFKSYVNFDNSGVTTIKKLHVEKSGTAPLNEKASFKNCPIKYVPKLYRGDEFLFNQQIVETSIEKDLREKTIKETINKIKSEANNIEL